MHEKADVMMDTKIGCLLLNFNDYSTTKENADILRKYPIFDSIVIVDNCSTDGSYDLLKKRYKSDKHIFVKMTNKNGGYGYGNNYGIKFLKNKLNTKYVVVSNPDAFFTNEMVLRLVHFMKCKNAAVVSGVQRINEKNIHDKAWKVPTVLSYTLSDTKLAHFINKYNYYTDDYFNTTISKVDCVPGAMFLVDADKFLKVGGFDEEMFLFCEETTLGYKLKKQNYTTFLVNDVFYDHRHSTSINRSLAKVAQQYQLIYKNRLLFMKKYLHASNLDLKIAKTLYDHKLKKIRGKQ